MKENGVKVKAIEFIVCFFKSFQEDLLEGDDTKSTNCSIQEVVNEWFFEKFGDVTLFF